MRNIVICFVGALAIVASGDGLFVPLEGSEERAVYDVGDTRIVWDDGQFVGLKAGDGVTPGGVWLYQASTHLRLSPLEEIAPAEYVVSLGGGAYWTNGVISLFQPQPYNPSADVTGVVTVRLLNASARIVSVVPHDAGIQYLIRTSFNSDRSAAVVTGTLKPWVSIPGMVAPDSEAYVSGFTVTAFLERSLVGRTNDLRAMTTFVPHPEPASHATNDSDYLVASAGWVKSILPAAVSQWFTHVATNAVTFLGGMVLRDALSPQQQFSVSVRNNGYLDLAYSAGADHVPVISVESIDPIPMITTLATGNVATLTWTTNGISGNWLIRTAPNLTGTWVAATTLTTNVAPAGYMSMTASNVIAGASAVFWRVMCESADQAPAQVRFGVPVRAPRYDLADGVYLFWSDGALRVQSGASNGVVSVAW